ncbi:MAG: fimbrillin family protein [Muribaculaceae bacterium]|nr:fimbrillin family protein [Muribaculaceae bacterium]
MKSICFFSGFAISSAVLALSLAGCSEDNSPFDLNSDKVVRFNVGISSDWNNGKGGTRSGNLPSAGTRSSAETRSLILSGDGDNLYLIPKIIDGIDLDDSPRSTRSSLSDKSNISSFGVFASLKPENVSSIDGLSPDYMYNVEVTRSNSWSPAEEYLWPGSGALHINAYSPFVTNPSDKEGITSIPSSSAKGALSLSFTTPTDVADQLDLLISSPVDAQSSPCDLVFNHALTAIRFATGSEMAPCSVKKIEISGVNASGSLNMESGEWSDVSSPMTFSVSPEISLSAAAGSSYVAPDTYITSADQTFLLIPQSLPEDAAVTMTIEIDGKESSLSASLSGASWKAGKTIVYRLSANPASDSFILEITDADGNPISSLQSDYMGSELDYHVRSIHQLADGDSTQVAWKAEFIDDAGNVVDSPQWISSFKTSGNGSEDLTASTTLLPPSFISISNDTQLLREATDINTSSGMTPYNLANASGASLVENTANCYLIHAPGKYEIPLVYGNAIKDGAPNPSAYTTTSSNQYALKTFLNHLGNGISDPYIYNNTGCTPASASIVWEGRLRLVEDVALSADKKFLTFTIPSAYIAQGNALLCVKDADGNIMWSWQIWVTPYNPEANIKNISYNGVSVSLLSRNLGQITTGDDTLYPAATAKVRFSQVDDSGNNPMSVTLTINQTEKEIKIPDCYSFYQWGRKDPMISDIKPWYGPEHKEITSFSRSDYDSYTGSLSMLSQYIRTPQTFWTSVHDKAHEYINLWNTDLSTVTNTKSIYDPCPVGFKVTFGTIFLDFANSGTLRTVSDSQITQTSGFYISLPGNSEEIFFPAYGYLQPTSGNSVGYGTMGQTWSAYYDGVRGHDRALLTNGRALVFSSTNITFVTDPRAFGFAVRPEKE